MVKRVAVFAAFDANGKIHRYVQTYLKELKKFAQKIIFVSDNDISAEELKKIDPIRQIFFSKKIKRHIKKKNISYFLALLKYRVSQTFEIIKSYLIFPIYIQRIYQMMKEDRK